MYVRACVRACVRASVRVYLRVFGESGGMNLHYFRVYKQKETFQNIYKAKNPAPKTYGRINMSPHAPLYDSIIHTRRQAYNYWFNNH